jgi:hypothetical protein
MSLLNNLSGAALRQAANLKDKIQTLEKELLKVLNNTTLSISGSGPSTAPKKQRKMSAAGRAKIAAAAKARWAKVRAAKPAPKAAVKPTAKPAVKPVAKAPAKKKGMSPAAKAKLSAAAKARWAKVKAAGKTKL